MNQFNVSLWGDEAWAATLISKTWSQIVTIVSHDTSPPFYYILAHAWTNFFGMNEISLRSLSLLFIFLTAVFAALIAREFWHKWPVTVLAGLLTFFNPFLFQYAFEARMYALLALMSTGATYFFIKKKWKCYVLFAALSLYTHHFSLFVIFWHFLWQIKEWIFKKDKLIQRLLPFIAIGILYLPWLPVMYQQTKMVTNLGFWLGKPVAKDLLEVLLKFLSGLNKYSWQVYAVIAGIAILIIRQWKIKDNKTWFLLGWLIVPTLTVFCLSQVMQPIFYDRYLINLIPAFVLILVSSFRKTWVSYVLIFAFVLITFKIDHHFFFNPTKRPFREMAAFIKQELKPGDSLINWSGQAHHIFESKYYGVYGPIYTPNGSLPFYTGTALMEPNDQISVLPKAMRIGVMTSEPIDKVSLPGYSLASQKQFDSLNFSWWTKNNASE
jgi:uncharacterized membrane protein